MHSRNFFISFLMFRLCHVTSMHKTIFFLSATQNINKCSQSRRARKGPLDDRINFCSSKIPLKIWNWHFWEVPTKYLHTLRMAQIALGNNHAFSSFLYKNMSNKVKINLFILTFQLSNIQLPTGRKFTFMYDEQSGLRHIVLPSGNLLYKITCDIRKLGTDFLIWPIRKCDFL